MSTDINWDALIEDANVDDSPPPASDYLVQIEKAEWTKSQKGKDMCKLRMRILAGPEKGKALFTQLVISPESPIALRIFFQDMKKLGLSADDLKRLSLREQEERLVGTEVKVTTVVKEWKGEPRAEVKSFTAIDGGSSKPVSSDGPPPRSSTDAPPPRDQATDESPGSTPPPPPPFAQ